MNMFNSLGVQIEPIPVVSKDIEALLCGAQKYIECLKTDTDLCKIAN